MVIAYNHIPDVHVGIWTLKVPTNLALAENNHFGEGIVVKVSQN